jgi:cation transport protein ChaC
VTRHKIRTLVSGMLARRAPERRNSPGRSTDWLPPVLVAHCERREPDPGPEPGRRYFTDVEYEAAAAKLIEQAPPGPLWVFAYGSLIWKPAIDTTEHRHAVAHGWHRSFCLRLTRWRGSPTQPAQSGLIRGCSFSPLAHSGWRCLWCAT